MYGVLSRPDHGGYRAEATVQRGQGDSIRYGASSEEKHDPVQASATDGYDGRFPGGGYDFPQATNRFVPTFGYFTLGEDILQLYLERFRFLLIEGNYTWRGSGFY